MKTAAELLVVSSEPLCAESPLGSQEDVLTRVSTFFVRNNFPIPKTVPGLTIGGAVARPITLEPEDLRRLPRRRLTATLECAGNGRSFMTPPVPGEPWRLGAVSTAEWEGVSLSSVLELAGVRPEAVEILFEGADGFARSLPRERALHPDSLLVDAMNGEPLTPNHGQPRRLLVPGWYGMASVKWLARIEALRTPFQGHFQIERYIINDRPVGEMNVRALILNPGDGTGVPLARQTVRGLAWTGQGQITSVELSDDGGQTWRESALARQPSSYAWCWWECDWRPRMSGPATLLARATDSAGRRQPVEPVWNSLGYCNNAAVPTHLVVWEP